VFKSEANCPFQQKIISINALRGSEPIAIDIESLTTFAIFPKFLRLSEAYWPRLLKIFMGTCNLKNLVEK